MIIKLKVRLNNYRYEILYYQNFVDFAQYFSLFRSFNIPCIAEDRLHQNIDKLAVAILSKLKSRSRTPTVMDFDHDCWRLLFHGKGKSKQKMLFKFYEREDFASCNFSAKWDQYLNKHGDGVKIKFPIKMKIHLSHSPKVFISHDNELIPGKRMYLERLTFDFVREPLSCN
jgi:hypothetical protein